MILEVDWPALRATRALGKSPLAELARQLQCSDRDAMQHMAASLGMEH